MENKGFNTFTKEVENKITKLINTSLDQGVPPIVMGYILKNAVVQLDNITGKVIDQEIKQSQQSETEKEVIDDKTK